MKQTLFIPLIASLGFVLAVGSATAQADQKPRQMTFEQLDANADGNVTRDEMVDHRRLQFNRADTDKDGFVSLAELEAQGVERARQRAAGMMERMDADSDGKISQDEITANRRSDKLFKRADIDGDGAVTRAEFDAAAAKMHARRN